MGQKKMIQVIENVEQVLIGKSEVVKLCIVALLAEGHILLEDVPGVGKTTMVKAFAKSLDAQFKRIQFTPDLLPSDVIGVSIYNPKEMEFNFRPGPIHGHIILADEINRTSPKTQAALLEAMEESSVTIDGETVELKRPFFVMATQNPIESEGTYSLPEAQLDRFLMKIHMGYPTESEEVEVLLHERKKKPLNHILPVMTIDELIDLQSEVSNVFIEETIINYIVQLARKTRENEDIQIGVSPRATIALMKVAQSYAYCSGRDYVIPDDVQYLMPFVFSHRIILRPEAKYRHVQVENILNKIIQTTKVPIQRARYEA